MKRLVHLYGGALVIACRREVRRHLREIGELLKRMGRKLVIFGEDTTPRWSLELFHQCYLADAEFHFGFDIYRGPIRAASSNGETLFFVMNWLAKKTDPHGDWNYEHGAGKLKFKVKDHSPPYQLENGDIWFTFDGGYAVLFLSKPHVHLEFKGPAYLLRWSTWF